MRWRVRGGASQEAHPRAFKAFEADGWDRQAKSYGSMTGAITARIAEPLLDAARVRSGARVLDVATGPGYIAGRAAARGARPVGIDISEGMLTVARAAYPGIKFTAGDAEQPSFDENSFDAVVGGFALNHLPQPELAASAAARLVAPGGAAAFSVWDSPERMRVIGVLSEAIAESGAGWPKGLPPGPDPYRFSDDREFTALLRFRGFSEVRVETVSFTHRVTGSGELWDGILGGSVRSAAVIRSQPRDAQRRIRDAFEARAEAYRSGDGLEVPVSAKIASGKWS